ncbi:hypothetical protein CIPAW_06G074500 [Carya illinoinensis]|uniref:Uncharacterized protein n=1 Tax=Carya illinoinensis TaxID=32201 RepID=A0A8T1Q949_CARIL|nr:hypothetical protein CIPAW_06G074500 [Carya illinoinensis]
MHMVLLPEEYIILINHGHYFNVFGSTFLQSEIGQDKAYINETLFTLFFVSFILVWDICSKAQIFALTGHDNTICSVFTRPVDPKLLLALMTQPSSFGTSDSEKQCLLSLTIKSWCEQWHRILKRIVLRLLQLTTLRNLTSRKGNSYITCCDNGSLWFWDWKSDHNFQQAQTIVQPGSLDSEAGIYATCYDLIGSRLVTCEADKTIKMWKEDENATPETHPVNFKPPKDIRWF